MDMLSLIGAEVLDESAQFALNEATLTAQGLLSAIASDADFLTKVTLAFGDGFDLTNASNTDIAKSQGKGTIKNDDTLISISDVTVTEGNGGLFTKNPKAVFTVSLSDASKETVTVDFKTQSGTASADADYKPTKGKVIFKPGEKKKTITVEVKGDKTIENDETFVVNLTNASNANIIDNQGVGRIRNDDSPVVNFGALATAAPKETRTPSSISQSLSATLP